MTTEDDKEVWRIAHAWPNYEVSSFGQVKRITPQHGATVGKILKPQIKNTGYPGYKLSSGGISETVLAHILVARTFIGMPSVGMEVCHGDGNKLNPKLSNLRYGTKKDNKDDMDLHGTKVRGEKIGTSVYKEERIRAVKIRLKNGAGLTECSREFSMPLSTIQGINEGRTWAWLIV